MATTETPAPKPVTLAEIRKEIARVYRSANHAANISCRAAHRIHDLHRTIERLNKDAIPESLRAALIAEAEQIKADAWKAYNETPDHRILQLCRLLGVEPNR